VATVLQIEAIGCTAGDLLPAVTWLREGGIVAFPTDTFYGLAVDPSSARAVKRLFDLKERDGRMAVPLVAASVGQVERLCGRLNPLAARLAAQFWPGPLSLVVDSPASIAREVHGGRRTIAIRVPAHRLAQALCAAFGAPLTATSANRSGAPAVVSAGALAFEADEHLLVIDGGATTGGLPSTIVDARGASPVLVRDGSIAWNRVLESTEG
jgi:L-threonylcarbamoyladenylate synthase